MYGALTLLGIASVGVVGATSAGGAPASPIPATGPTTSVNPYVVSTNSSVEVESLLTVNDPTKTATNGFKMVGIPDGIGQYQAAPGGDVTVLNNQELTSAQGINRTHGQKGAFVTKYTVDPNTLEVKTGADFMQNNVQYYDYATGTYGSAPTGTFLAAFGRFCSSDLATELNLYNAATGNGYNGKIYFANEETGSEGRVLGIDMSGNAVQLPKLGLFSWENTVTAPQAGDTTLVMGQEDGTPSGPNFDNHGFLWVYAGAKTNTGSPFDKAGLTNGSLFGMKISDAVHTDQQFRTTFGKFNAQPFSLVGVNWNQTGVAQSASLTASKAMAFFRTEDGAWDPQHPNDYYFVTTDQQGNSGKGGLWRARFTDRNNPAAGGSLALLLDGTEGVFFPDNITIDTHGHILIQEDPGGNNYVAGMYAYDIATTRLARIATFDPAKFTAGPNLWTNDEESSGVIDTENTLGAGWFLFDAQVHTTAAVPAGSGGVPGALPAGTGPGTVQEYVEHGQLLAMKVGDWNQLFAQGPAPVTPEVPYAVILPIGGLLVAGGGLFILQRRRSRLAMTSGLPG